MKAFARRVRDRSKQSLRTLMLRSGMAALERRLRAGRVPDASLMQRLVRGWGNEAWSAGTPLLMAALHWLPRSHGPVLECGSGLTTLVMASAAVLMNRRVISLEHDASWAERVQRALPSRLQTTVDLNVTPIRSYPDFDWYDIEPASPPRDIGFVMCDGPPGKTRGGRYGLSQVLGSRLAPGCLVLVDDTQRPAEDEIVRRWCSELDGSVVHRASTYTVLSVGRPMS
jgi:Methyltransferase domain